MAAVLAIEVVYALPDCAVLRAVRIAAGATLREAIERSGILADCPDIDLRRNAVGVFGRVRGLDEPVAAGDRVEIYRPLAADPKDRRRRAAKGRRMP